MHDILLEKPELLNAEALEEQLRSIFGPALRGISTGSYGLRLHLAGPLSETQLAQARAAVRGHEAAKLTSRQQAALEVRQRLEQARMDNTTPLNLQVYGAQDVLIRQLAQKIAWLEQELAALRSGEAG